MHPYERILCAVDFSAPSDAAAERAALLARQFGAALTLLHIVEYWPVERSNERIPPENVDPTEYEATRSKLLLAGLAAGLEIESADQVVLFSAHSAWHEIIRWAGQRNVNLIVQGSHGHHGIDALLGSTANAVINLSPCDVLTVRKGK